MENSYKKVVSRQARDNPEQSRRVAIFDLDGTLVDAHLWAGIVKHNFKTRESVFPTIWFIVSHMVTIPLWAIKLISTEEYYGSWIRDIPGMLKGLNSEKAKEIFNWLSDKYLLPTLKKNTFERLKKHQKDGFLTVLISGSFQDSLDVLANRLNIDFAIGTKLEIIEDKISGRIIPPLCFGRGKPVLLKNLFAKKELKINFRESFAYSDRAIDLPMLQLVGNPVAVNPDKKLFNIAKHRGWEIII